MHWKTLIAVGALAACPSVEAAGSNVLLIVADDVGVDVLRAYADAPDLPATPALDRLADEGLVFENVWANPTCSSTRATILTGRYTFRTGVADVVKGSTNVLSLEEWTLPEVLDRAGGAHQHALLGKWHLGSLLNGGANGPNLAGYGHYSGSLGAFPVPSYARWAHTRDGVTTSSTDYATSQLVDEALAWIASRDGPWFLQLAFQAAHRPWHVPPSHLVGERTRAALSRNASGGLSTPGATCPGARARLCYLAMVEAMSTEIGRLLDSMPAIERGRTNVFFVADNGTPHAGLAKSAPRHQSKGQLYEGGIHVPLIARGPAVTRPGSRTDALVNTTDLFATIIELATGRSASELLPSDVVLDARSLVPILNGDAGQVREYAFSERLHAARLEQNGQAIRNVRFKLIRRQAGSEELYDLIGDPGERADLVDSSDAVAAANLRALRSALSALSPRPVGVGEESSSPVR